MTYFLLDKHYASNNTQQAPAWLYSIYLQNYAHGEDGPAETKKLLVDLAFSICCNILDDKWCSIEQKKKFLSY